MPVVHKVSSGTSGWQTLVNLDLAGIAPANWLTGAHTLGGAPIAFDRAAATVLGPDGTGLQFTSSGDTSWDVVTRLPVNIGVGIADMAGDLSSYDKIAIMVSAVPTLTTAFSVWHLGLEDNLQATSAIVVMQRCSQNSGIKKVDAVAHQGGTDASTAGWITANPAAIPQSQMLIFDWKNKTLAFWWDLALRTVAPDPSDPAVNGWTLGGNDASGSHLQYMRASLSLATLRLVFGLSGWYTGGKGLSARRITIQGYQP